MGRVARLRAFQRGRSLGFLVTGGEAQPPAHLPTPGFDDGGAGKRAGGSVSSAVVTLLPRTARMPVCLLVLPHLLGRGGDLRVTRKVDLLYPRSTGRAKPRLMRRNTTTLPTL